MPSKVAAFVRSGGANLSHWTSSCLGVPYVDSVPRVGAPAPPANAVRARIWSSNVRESTEAWCTT